MVEQRNGGMNFFCRPLIFFVCFLFYGLVFQFAYFYFQQGCKLRSMTHLTLFNLMSHSKITTVTMNLAEIWVWYSKSGCESL